MLFCRVLNRHLGADHKLLYYVFSLCRYIKCFSHLKYKKYGAVIKRYPLNLHACIFYFLTCVYIYLLVYNWFVCKYFLFNEICQ